jgi:hypothetical protein
MTAAVAGAMATPLALAAPASATADGTGAAYGIAADGLVNIPPTPAVASSAHQPSRKSLIALPANQLIQAGVLNAEAWAGHGRASVADVRLAEIGLSAELISAKCENGNAVSHLANVTVAGRRLDVSPKPNSSVPVVLDKLGLVTLTLNKQAHNPDGGLTVTAIELTIKLVDKVQTVSIASATCNAGSEEPPTTPGGPNPTPAPPGEAPAPTPVTGDLPVTG